MVIDASVAVKWVVAEEQHDIALRLARSSIEFAAPSVLVPELINVLRKKVLRKELSAEQAVPAAAKATALIKQFVDLQDKTAEIMAMSLALNHPAYDCCYIAAAKSIGAILVTAAGVEAHSLGAWARTAG